MSARAPTLTGSTTTIKVGDSTWFVPAGFGRAYRDAGSDPAAPDVLRDLLELVHGGNVGMQADRRLV